MIGRRRLLRGAVATCVLLVTTGVTYASAAPESRDGLSPLSALGLPFIANDGQVDARVAYYAPTSAGMLFVTRRGQLVYSLPPRTPTSSTPGWTLTETFDGARARPAGQRPSPTRAAVFVGNDPSRWRGTLATYDEVGLGQAWRGVDVGLRARGRGVEKVFTVSPGASTGAIRVRVGGARGLSVNAGGASSRAPGSGT